MTQRAALVTGATGGLGWQTARRLHAAGWTVVVGGRTTASTQRAVATLSADGPPAVPFVADLGDLGQVNRALERLDIAEVHGIVTNAGITLDRSRVSADGYELTFAVNVLAHQLILRRMAERLAPEGRVVVVASGVHIPDHRLARRSGVPVPRWVGADALAAGDAAPADRRVTDTRQRYSTSKLGNVLQAQALQHRLRTAVRDADVFAIDPGLMVDTRLARSYPAALRFVLRGVGTAVTPLVGGMRRSSMSAAHVHRLLDDPALLGHGFQYFDGADARPPSAEAQRDDLAHALWADANRLVDTALGRTSAAAGDS